MGVNLHGLIVKNRHLNIDELKELLNLDLEEIDNPSASPDFTYAPESKNTICVFHGRKGTIINVTIAVDLFRLQETHLAYISNARSMEIFVYGVSETSLAFCFSHMLEGRIIGVSNYSHTNDGDFFDVWDNDIFNVISSDGSLKKDIVFDCLFPRMREWAGIGEESDSSERVMCYRHFPLSQQRLNEIMAKVPDVEYRDMLSECNDYGLADLISEETFEHIGKYRKEGILEPFSIELNELLTEEIMRRGLKVPELNAAYFSYMKWDDTKLKLAIEPYLNEPKLENTQKSFEDYLWRSMLMNEGISRGLVRQHQSKWTFTNSYEEGRQKVTVIREEESVERDAVSRPNTLYILLALFLCTLAALLIVKYNEDTSNSANKPLDRNETIANPSSSIGNEQKVVAGNDKSIRTFTFQELFQFTEIIDRNAQGEFLRKTTGRMWVHSGNTERWMVIDDPRIKIEFTEDVYTFYFSRSEKKVILASYFDEFDLDQNEFEFNGEKVFIRSK